MVRRWSVVVYNRKIRNNCKLRFVKYEKDFDAIHRHGVCNNLVNISGVLQNNFDNTQTIYLIDEYWVTRLGNIFLYSTVLSFPLSLSLYLALSCSLSLSRSFSLSLYLSLSLSLSLSLTSSLGASSPLIRIENSYSK